MLRWMLGLESEDPGKKSMNSKESRRHDVLHRHWR